MAQNGVILAPWGVRRAIRLCGIDVVVDVSMILDVLFYLSKALKNALMVESEIKTLVTTVRGFGNICLFLVVCHGIPHFITLLVFPHIEAFGK